MTEIHSSDWSEPDGRLELVPCPECELPAEVERRDSMGSTSGLFGMIKIRCLDRHWFYLPATSLATGFAAGG